METNVKFQADHEVNRSKVCAMCGSKIVFGSQSQSKFIISKNVESLIKKLFNENFDVMDSRVPKSICTSCKVGLYERNRGNVSRNLPRMPDYLGRDLTNRTCDHDGQHLCCCYICRTGRSKAHTQLRSIKNQPILKICKKCFAEIISGKPHVCKRNAAHKNIVTNMEHFPEKTKDNVIHKLLATKVTKVDPSSSLQNAQLSLKTGGREARVVLNPLSSVPIKFTEEKLDNFITNSGSLPQ